MRTQVLLLLFWLAFNITSYSQVSDSLFVAFCQDENLIILEEEMDVNITGEKALYMNVNIINTTKFVIQNDEGLKEFQQIVLPKRFDELYICHAPTIRNIDWAYEQVRVKHFTASLLQNGQEIPLKVHASVTQKRVINSKGFFGNIDLYNYKVEGLATGDTVTISYHYWIAFKDNWIRLLSNRLFFHGKYPKKAFKLSWCYNITMEVDSQFVNLRVPEVSINKNTICYRWEMNNLPGALDEPNSRPYEELPHFIFVPKPYDFEYTLYDSYKMEFIPIYFFLANKRQNNIRVEMWDNVIGNKNKDNLHYQKVARKIIALAGEDSTGTERMIYFQQFLVDSVVYKNAEKYYDYQEQQIRQRAGVDLWGYSVSDNNLELIYGNMVTKLTKDLLTAYPIDKRVGTISPTYCPTVNNNDLIYNVIFNDGTAGYVIPKSDKNHYYFDELPFYYEDIPVMLIHIYDYANPTFIYSEDYDFTSAFYPFDYGSGRRNYNTNYRWTQTPSSNMKENYRKVQSMVNIDLENNRADFRTRLILSGQYSTLTRCVYCNKPIDSTINPKYLEPVWDIAEAVQVKKVKPGHPLIYYPFKTTISAEYSVNDIVQNKEGQFELKPAKWFKIIWNEVNTSEVRFLDYYPDFVGSDQYSYMIVFDKPVVLISKHSKKEVSNDYARFCFEVSQTEENKILLTCNYNIKVQHVEKKNYNKVAEINAAISALKQEKIIFKTVQ